MAEKDLKRKFALWIRPSLLRPAFLPALGETTHSQPSHKITQGPSLAPGDPLWQNKPWLVPGETLGYEVPVFSFRKSTGFLRLGRACVESFHPRWGTDPSQPGQGRFGPHRAQFSRKERKQPSPENNRQRRRRICQLLTSHRAHGFLKNQQWREV